MFSHYSETSYSFIESFWTILGGQYPHPPMRNHPQLQKNVSSKKWSHLQLEIELKMNSLVGYTLYLLKKVLPQT